MINKKFIFKISISIILCVIFVWGIWHTVIRDYIETNRREKELFSRVLEQRIPGYTEEERPPISGYTFTSYQPRGHEDEDIERVVDRVLVTVFEFGSSETAQQEIERASLVYLWDWREEVIGGKNVRTGYLLDLEKRIFPEAYLAWTEDNVYFEILAQPKPEFVGAEDKEFLYQAAREVAESILQR